MATRRRFLSGTGAVALALAAQHLLLTSRSTSDASVRGQITAAGAPIANARITLFTPDLTSFREVRTNGAGQYTIDGVPSGVYQLGACALGREYREVTINVSEPGTIGNFTLGPDVHPGAWALVGSTEPETFGGTNAGSLMSDGRIFYCHDATDPIVFDPATGTTSRAARSSSEQGSDMPTHLLDGRLHERRNFRNVAANTPEVSGHDRLFSHADTVSERSRCLYELCHALESPPEVAERKRSDAIHDIFFILVCVLKLT